MLNKAMLLGSTNTVSTKGTVFTVDVGEWRGEDGQTHRGYYREYGIGSISPTELEGKTINRVIFMGYDDGASVNGLPPWAFLGAKINFDHGEYDDLIGMHRLRVTVLGGPSGEQQTILDDVSGTENVFIGDAIHVYPMGEHTMIIDKNYSLVESDPIKPVG